VSETIGLHFGVIPESRKHFVPEVTLKSWNSNVKTFQPVKTGVVANGQPENGAVKGIVGR